ncbi:MAG: efflux RND transporter periplasmic adaptor subunit [Alphaproteobacteria bacterium]|nr:efflux RND transporter periplasmic adaptor subunit [Alphaproteobacteria bacterium]
MQAGKAKLPTSYLIAGVLALVAATWILSGVIGGSESPATAPAANELAAETKKPAVKVRVRRLVAETHKQELVLRGQTEASRSVELKAETSSVVETITAKEGSRVKEGQVIIELARDHRDARLAEARALVRQREVDFAAASKLAKKGFTAETRLAETRALLDAARAALKSIEVDLEDVTIEAPFDGVLERRYVETGDFLDVGDPVAQVMDLDPLYVVAQVSERDIGQVERGDVATARLLSGQEVEGFVTYVGASADAETRTFRVEIEVLNQDLKLADGVSTEVRLSIDQVRAHLVSPAVLTLDDLGNVGIKTVNGDNIVEFHIVEIASDQTDGIWLAGLPDTIDLITVGQEFVKPDQVVEPVYVPAAAAQ